MLSYFSAAARIPDPLRTNIKRAKAQHLVRGIIQIEDGSGFVQLLLGERKRVQVFSHVGASAGRAGKQAPPWVSLILMQVGSVRSKNCVFGLMEFLLARILEL